jgi:hypothetical protein
MYRALNCAPALSCVAYARGKRLRDIDLLQLAAPLDRVFAVFQACLGVSALFNTSGI